MKCADCRKHEALDTWDEKVASWLVHHLFPKTLRDEVNAQNIKRFEEGYEVGRKHERELNSLALSIKRLEHISQQPIDKILREII